MSITTSLDIPASRSSLLVRRRITTYFVGGVQEIPNLVAALAQRGHSVHELSVDIREGVRESSMVCTILLPGDAIEPLLDYLRELPAVVSSDLA
ncbi:hypothetical protein FNH05_13375 [Amycolatopsis rhizosphaerae]|uniref:ACT domain-containing protein n=1 Tax=Amycolatopsis rhizosphaerae TaxID=2053003 RepID=A0A558CTT6_9PSEU|nr:hypothetical protein [Amycolatopsis rhizosphaerae]TVT52166.1 hypothetical protein FNH05_13375 [Amycolatopsis rhizosphaerae]